MRELLSVGFYTRFVCMWAVALLIAALCLVNRVHLSAVNALVVAGAVLLTMLLYPAEVQAHTINRS